MSSENVSAYKNSPLDGSNFNEPGNAQEAVQKDPNISRGAKAVGMEQAMAGYLRKARAQGRLSSATIQSQKQDLMHLCFWLEQEEIEDDLTKLTKADLDDFLREYMVDHASSSTSRMISTLRVFFKWARQAMDVPDLAQFLHPPKKLEKLPLWISGNEAMSMLEACAQEKYPELCAALTASLYFLGLRVSEACSLSLRHVRLDHQRARVLGKGGKTRTIPIAPACSIYLQKYLETRPKAMKKKDEGLFFLNQKGRPVSRQFVFQLVKRLAAACRLSEHISPHTLRHSFATRLIENDVSLISIQKLLGHSDIRTTQIYIHTDASRLVRIYDGAMKQPSSGSFQSDLPNKASDTDSDPAGKQN